MAKKEEMGNVPNLRFPGFEGRWEVKKLEDITVNISSGKSRMKAHGNLYPFYGSTGVVAFSNEFDYSGRKILVARVGANAGTLYIVSGKYCVSDNTLVVDVDTEYDLNFTYSNLIKANLNQFVFGSGQPLITGGQLKSLYLWFPDFIEQQKISSFLTIINERIKTQSKIIQRLETSMQNLREMLLTQKIRFKDSFGRSFANWEKRRLGDIAIKKSSNISANKIEENFGEYIIYGASGILKKVDFYEEENDYISIVKDGAGVGRLLYCKGKSSVLGTMDIIKPNLDVDTYFLYCILSSIDFIKYISGSTIPHIYFKDYKSESSNIPTLEEQNLIANLLWSISNKIDIEKQLLLKYQNQKKYLLKNLFI